MTATKDRTVASERDPVEPDQLLTAFSRKALLLFIVLSLVAHVVVIGGMSVGYIQDTYIDPDAARLRKEQEKAEQDKAQAEKMAKEAAARGLPATGQPAAGSATRAAAAPPAAGPATRPAADGIPDEVRNSPAYRRATELPKAGETPTSPDDEILKSIDEKAR